MLILIVHIRAHLLHAWKSPPQPCAHPLDAEHVGEHAVPGRDHHCHRDIMDKVVVSHGRGDGHRYGHAVPARNNHLDHNHGHGQTCGHDKDLDQSLPTSRRKATSYAELIKQTPFLL